MLDKCLKLSLSHFYVYIFEESILGFFYLVIMLDRSDLSTQYLDLLKYFVRFDSVVFG